MEESLLSVDRLSTNWGLEILIIIRPINGLFGLRDKERE